MIDHERPDQFKFGQIRLIFRNPSFFYQSAKTESFYEEEVS